MSDEGVIRAAEHLLVVRPTPEHQRQVVDEWAPVWAINRLLDTSWTYRLFPWEAILAYPGYLCMAAVLDDVVEGLLAISINNDILKVEFVAAAPWNFGPDRKVSGVGSGLLAVAVQIARDSRCKSVILSSTPESETFYEHVKFTRTGAIDREGLAVFELTSSDFAQLLARYSPIPMQAEKEDSSVGSR